MAALSVKEFSLDELRKATNNFSEDNKLGEGGFGVVYRGRLSDNSVVAIKRLRQSNPEDSSEAEIQFIRETSMPKHGNLLPLLGICKNEEPREMLLVFPLMVNGSLADCLIKSNLDWKRRKVIAHGTAVALSYLHDQFRPSIIHRDIKPDNVLLNENMEAVVADFGLVRLMDTTRTHVSTKNVYGTRGYIPPEYLIDGRFSEKTDVYAYGILLLEIITGSRAKEIVPSTANKRVKIPDWTQKQVNNNGVGCIIDPNLQGNYVNEEAEKLIGVALQCTKQSPEERPKMSEVVEMVEDFLSS